MSAQTISKEEEMVTIKQMFFEKLKFRLQQEGLSSALARDIRYKEEIFNAYLDTTIAKIQIVLWSNKIREEVQETIKFPRDWWQAVKERFFPKFLKRKYPVKYQYRDIVFHHFHTCPHIDRAVEGNHLEFLSEELK